MANYRIPSDYQNEKPQALHDWSSPFGGTIHPGLVYPVHHRHVNAGDRVRGRLTQLVQSQAMLGPLLNGFKLVTFATFTPDTVLYGWMRNGIRYDSKDLVDFGKFTFNPVKPTTDVSKASYEDPVFDSRVNTLTWLNPGISTTVYNDDLGYYNAWVSDLSGYTDSEGLAHPYDLGHVGRGGLFDWLGVAPGAVAPNLYSSPDVRSTSTVFNFNIAPAVAYFLSYYYYVANMQEQYMYFTRSVYDMSRNYVDDYALGTSLPMSEVFNSFDPNDFLNLIDSFAFGSNSKGYAIRLENGVRNEEYSYNSFFSWLLSGFGGHGGLFPAPYSPDLFNNIIRVGESPSVTIPVERDEAGFDSVAVPQMRLKTKIQSMMDRLFVSGGRFGDILRTLMGTKGNPYVNKPDFLGIWQSGINPSNVIAQAVGINGDESSSVGQMAAHLDKFSKFEGSQSIDYYAKVPGTVMFFSMLIPQVSYCQGLHPDLVEGTFADDFNPEMNGLGFLSVPRHRYSLMPQNFTSEIWTGEKPASANTPDPNIATVGDTVAWDWLKTDYPRLHGEFAQNGVYQYWTMPRRFTETYMTPNGESALPNVWESFSTYINPLQWQYLFASQTFADPNFVLVGNIDLRVTNAVLSNYMPYMGR
ncbi:hypothetical protein [Alistipes sp.]|uniref:hypothetical protein n=1 Tax=Alistipes sp. TaxID=1872444 RepID=UPI0025C72366|nr:hypothetical protein [Alistipes sp.]